MNTLTLLCVGCVRFPHSTVASFILSFPVLSIRHTSHYSSFSLSPSSSYQPSWSCHLPPFFPCLLSFSSPPSFLAQHFLDFLVLIVQHLPLLIPVPLLLPVSSSSSFSSPPIIVCFGSQWSFFYKITALPQRNDCMLVTHVIVRKCCQSVLAYVCMNGEYYIERPPPFTVVVRADAITGCCCRRRQEKKKLVCPYLLSPLLSKHMNNVNTLYAYRK